MSAFQILCVAVAVAGGAVSCTEATGPSDVERTPNALAVQVPLGGAAWLEGAVRDSLSLGPDAPLTYETADPSIATVDTVGAIRGVSTGRAVVTARAGDASVALAVLVRRVTYADVKPHGPSGGCALTTEGEALCWGDNHDGLLGTSTSQRCYWISPHIPNSCGSAHPSAPVFVATAERFVAIDVGGWRACGLTRDGRVFCWGARLSAGEQPAPPLCEQRSGAQCDYAPRQVPASRPYVAIVVGNGYEDDNVMCGLAADGTADCWGNNYLGRTGTGTASSTAAQITTPTRLAGNVVLRNVTAGWSHACGERLDGAVLCWGDKWALGNDTLQAPPAREVPAPIAAASGMILHGVTAGGGSTCGLSSAGEAYCWIYGRTPHPVAPGRTFTRLAAASWFACGLEVNGAMSCWVYLTAPVPVAPGVRFRSVAVTDMDGDNVCGIAIDGGAYCAVFTNSSASGGTAGPPRRVPGDI